MKHRYIPIVVLLSLVTCGLVTAAEHDFQKLVGALEARFSAHRTSIPFMGMARFVVKASHPSGVHEMDLATIEDLNLGEGGWQRFGSTVRSSLGDSWQMVVQVRSKKSGEYTGIFAKTSGGQLKMMLATLQDRQATVIELRLGTKEFLNWLRDPERVGTLTGDERKNEGGDE